MSDVRQAHLFEQVASQIRSRLCTRCLLAPAPACLAGFVLGDRAATVAGERMVEALARAEARRGRAGCASARRYRRCAREAQCSTTEKTAKRSFLTGCTASRSRP